MAEPGAVAWQFERKGAVIVPRSVEEEDLLLVALDAGAADIVDEGDTWRVTSPPTALPSLRESLEGASIPFDSADITMLPSTTNPLPDAESAKKVLRLLDALDDHDDVQNGYANFDIPDEILATAVAE